MILPILLPSTKFDSLNSVIYKLTLLLSASSERAWGSHVHTLPAQYFIITFPVHSLDVV
ncbi:unnamed protein product [Penicillium camemberti]|uniref:Str. FM013 n=1 Tax=Penicillium camemberti (strain FM 013) TaxID=1429867 RepID=A0A0G4P4T3_PENC3|nr:unnamed protein product [Penicillium camemberti]